MKIKSKLSILILVIVSAILLALLVFVFLNPVKVNTPKADTINELVKEQKDKIIFITDSKDESLKESEKLIKEFKKIYKLDILTLDKSKYSVDYKKVLKSFNIDGNIFAAPALIILKNGVVNGTIVNFQNSKVLAEFLVEQNIIDESEVNKRKEIISEDYQELYKSTLSTVILLGTDDSSIASTITVLENLGVNYKYMLVTTVDALEAKHSIEKEIGLLNYPHIIIVGDNKILAHTENMQENSIKQFLEENNKIK